MSKLIGSDPIISPSASTQGSCVELALMCLPLTIVAFVDSGLPGMHAASARHISKPTGLTRQDIDLKPWVFKLRVRSYTHAAAVTFAVADQRKDAFIVVAVHFDDERLCLPREHVFDARYPISELARLALEALVDAARNRSIKPDARHHEKIPTLVFLALCQPKAMRLVFAFAITSAILLMSKGIPKSRATTFEVPPGHTARAALLPTML